MRTPVAHQVSLRAVQQDERSPADAAADGGPGRTPAFVLRMHGELLLASFLIATSFPVAAYAAGKLSGTLLTLLRFLVAASCFLPLVLVRHSHAAIPSRSALARYALLSAPLVAYFVAMFEALETTTATRTGALFTLAPCFAAVFSRLLTGERSSTRRVLALTTGMLGAAGVILASTPLHGAWGTVQRGDVVFLVGTAAFGLYVALIKRLHRGEPMEIVTCWTLITGSGWLLLVGGTELSKVPWHFIERELWGAIGYLAIFTTLVTFLLTQRGTRALGPTRSAAYSYLTPTFVALISGTLTHPEQGPRVLPGIALSLVSVWLLQRDAR